MKTTIKNVTKFALMLTLVFGMSALVSAQSKTPVKVADLQKSITDYIAKDYAGYTVKDAYKVDKNKVITFGVNVEKEGKMVCLSFDNSGKFLKVIEPKTKTSSTTKTTTNTKTSTGNNKKTTK